MAKDNDLVLASADDLNTALFRASQWKYVKKTDTFVATVADFIEKRIGSGRFSKLINVPTNVIQMAFSRAQMDDKDPRLAKALLAYNAVFEGANRRREMARALRHSYYLWNRQTQLQHDGNDVFINKIKFINPDFKNATNFFMILECLTLMHDPAKLGQAAPTHLQNIDFPLATTERVTIKTTLNQTDLEVRYPGIREKMAVAVALDLPMHARSRFILDAVKPELTAELPDIFADGVDFEM